MDPTFLRELHSHTGWADALVLDAVRALDSETLDPNLFKTLLHLHSTQNAFLTVWKGDTVDWNPAKRLTTLAELRARAREYHSGAEVFMAGLEQGDLERETILPWSVHLAERMGRPADPTSLGDTLYQVSAHSTYHRGQANRRIRELGGEPPLVDYIAWVWLGRPAAAWDRLNE